MIWLRELRDYADAEGGQESLARLARLLVGNGRVIAIATTWERFWNAYSRDHRGARVPVTPTLRRARCWQGCQRWLA